MENGAMMERETIRNFEDVQAFGRGNIDAVMTSTTALTRGMQNVAAEVANFSRRAFEHGADAMEKVLAARSFTKVFEIQQDYARSAFDAYLGEVTKLNEICLATAKEAFRPYEARIEEATAKIGEASHRVTETATKAAQAATRTAR
jgi:hypothetical protein